jgi:hypothetical protein
LFQRLRMRRMAKHCCGCCEPACGCCEPACGCAAPSCGCY